MEGAAVGRLTPFMLFYTEHRDAVKARINTHSSSRATTPPLSQDISREICRLWQLLTPQQTKEYCLLSNLYAESLSKFGSRRSSGGNASAGGRQAKNANNSSSGGSSSSRSRRKKDARLSGLPKPAVSSFMWFSRHHRAILRTENREMTFSDIGKAVGVLWKSATDEQKRPFDDLSTEDKARYARELAEYKAWLLLKQGSKESKGEVPTQADKEAAAAAAAATAAAPTPRHASVAPPALATAAAAAAAAASAPAAEVPVPATTTTAATPVAPAPIPAPPMKEANVATGVLSSSECGRVAATTPVAPGAALPALPPPPLPPASLPTSFPEHPSHDGGTGVAMMHPQVKRQRREESAAGGDGSVPGAGVVPGVMVGVAAAATVEGVVAMPPMDPESLAARSRSHLPHLTQQQQQQQYQQTQHSIMQHQHHQYQQQQQQQHQQQHQHQLSDTRVEGPMVLSQPSLHYSV